MEPLPAEIQTPRLTIRVWRVDDAESQHKAVVASVEHLRPWMAWVAFEPLTVEDRKKNIATWGQDWASGGDAIFGVFLEDTAIGGCGLHRRRGPGALEIGYWIHADHTRKGYTTELARGLTDAAFTVDGIDRVEIHHDKANHISGRIPSGLGYQNVAEVEDEIVAPGETGVSLIWQTTKVDWQALQTQVQPG